MRVHPATVRVEGTPAEAAHLADLIHRAEQAAGERLDILARLQLRIFASHLEEAAGHETTPDE